MHEQPRWEWCGYYTLEKVEGVALVQWRQRKLSLLMPMGEDKHGQCIGTDKVKLVLPVVQDDFMCGDLSFF